ncbi:MAG TPA: hypothetical protein VE987_11190 [Polyangiaceae bacterium]|nr:hypothetical protein [Polyangiaceae bacterium]
MVPASNRARWLGQRVDPLALGLVGLAVVAVIMLVFELSLGLHPGLNFAFACVLILMLAWSTLGLRAAIGEPDVRRWVRLYELAGIGGAVAAVDVPTKGHERTTLAQILPGAHLKVLSPADRTALELTDSSCDAVVVGPGVVALDETMRVALLDEAMRVLRVGGRLVLMVPAEERRGLLSITPVEWSPGAPPGWWSEALSERFAEVRHAPLSRRLDVLLARRAEPGEA